MITAQEALQRLQEGNRRFVAAESTAGAPDPVARRNQLLSGQEPFA
ncbi:MAG: carbonic anhydrase, partial [Pseudomonadales bacterium]|nr:carbonic anhydrase [Pseudomonadales bacterium]